MLLLEHQQEEEDGLGESSKAHVLRGAGGWHEEESPRVQEHTRDEGRIQNWVPKPEGTVDGTRETRLCIKPDDAAWSCINDAVNSLAPTNVEHQPIVNIFLSLFKRMQKFKLCFKLSGFMANKPHLPPSSPPHFPSP